ncbi:MAG TPA: hypothetical protein VNA57_04385 [Acidimicrobiales bacterium]|nr:hypothetical protein [Acidimicrobiales bacterium]
MSRVYSTSDQLERIGELLQNYFRLPFAAASIPGAYAETVLARVREGEVLNTYDFIDVVAQEGGYGWQVKSTKQDTPVTWKRAKIPNAASLIQASHESDEGVQALGRAVINFCNEHVHESMRLYRLDEIGYARVVVRAHDIVYFERLLVGDPADLLFDPEQFWWRWSEPKKTQKKEQLQALHGIHGDSNAKWWAAHLLGENQLHFSGEAVWSPGAGDEHSITLPRPDESQRLAFEDFIGWFAEQTRLGAQQQRMAALAELASALTELLQVTPESELAVAASETIALALRTTLAASQDDIGREALAESAQRVYVLAEAAADYEETGGVGELYAAIQEATERLLQ